MCGSHQGLGKGTYRGALRQIRWSGLFSGLSVVPRTACDRPRGAAFVIVSRQGRRIQSDVDRPGDGEHHHGRLRPGSVAPEESARVLDLPRDQAAHGGVPMTVPSAAVAVKPARVAT